MAKKTLEQMVEERQQEAKSKQILERVSYICEKIGEKYSERVDQGEYYSYPKDGFVVRFKDLIIDCHTIYDFHRELKGAEIKVSENITKILGIFPKKNWKTVYAESAGEGVTSYIPGPWERDLKNLYNYISEETTKEEAAKYISQKLELENSLRNRFGL